jgi:alpha-glucosidase
MVLLITYPGVPSIFAGDEIGMKGAWGEDARRTIDWDKRDWDLEFFENVKKIVKIRRNSSALADGGLRWVAIEDDLIAYLRESKSEKILVVVARAAAKLDLRSFQINERLFGIELKRGRFKTPFAASGIYRLA